MTRSMTLVVVLGGFVALAARANPTTYDTGGFADDIEVTPVAAEEEDTGRPEWGEAEVIALPAQVANEVHEAFPELTIDTFQ